MLVRQTAVTLKSLDSDARRRRLVLILVGPEPSYNRNEPLISNLAKDEQQQH
jgi:hypothetical protein